MQKSRILVVEDDALSRELLCDWLAMEGYAVRAAADLSASLAAVRAQQPQIVLLDVNLGGEDGLALASWMRGHPEFSHIPIIAVTAHAMMTERDRILEAGCNAFVPKPIDFKLLQEHLARWLPESAR